MKKMLRNAALTAVIGLFAASSMAQESDMDDRKFRFGLVASPNLGWVRPNIQDFEKSGLQARLGFGYGLMMDFKFSESPNYLFATGINMTNNGGALIEPLDSLDVIQVDDTTTLSNYYYGKVNRAYRVQYVTVPLLLKNADQRNRVHDLLRGSWIGCRGKNSGLCQRQIHLGARRCTFRPKRHQHPKRHAAFSSWDQPHRRRGIQFVGQNQSLCRRWIPQPFHQYVSQYSS